MSLSHFDLKLEIIVTVDTSESGTGSVILHKYEHGSLKAVDHALHSSLLAGESYSQIKKDALAIKFAVKKLHKFIHGRKFCLQTDCCLFLLIYGSKESIPKHRANRLQHWE